MKMNINLMVFIQEILYIKNVIPLKKTLVLSIACSKCENESKKIFKEEESIEI